MTTADFATVGRIEFGPIISLSFRLLRLEWRRLALLSVLFLWAPYEVYARIYAAAGQGGAAIPLKYVSLVGDLALIGSYNIGVAIALRMLLNRLDGPSAGARRPLLGAVGAFPVGVVLSIVGNLPNLAAIFAGTPTQWGDYIALIAVNSVVLFGVNLMVGVAMPVALQERKGPGRAIARAAELSQGSRWRLAPILFAFQAGFVVGYVLLVAFGAAWAREVAAQLAYVWIAVASLPAVAATAVIYRELRRIRDGLTNEELTGIFG